MKCSGEHTTVAEDIVNGNGGGIEDIKIFLSQKGYGKLINNIKFTFSNIFRKVLFGLIKIIIICI